MTGPTPPTVDEGMREAVAHDVGTALVKAGPGIAIGVGVFEQVADYLLRNAGPIASALAARERERDEARGLAERLGFELETIGTENDELEEQAEEDARTIATLRASAERMEAEAEARGMRAGIDQAVDAIRTKLNEPDDGCMSPDYWSGLGIALDAVTEVATAAPAETEERGTGWRPIETAPKDGRMIGVVGGCAYWSFADQCWVSGVGGAYGRRIRWPLTVWKDLTSPQPTATATREDGHA